MKKVFVFLFVVAFIFGTFNMAPAELRDNGDGTVTQISNDGTWRMWLKDANVARTLGYDSDGKMSWDEAVAFIDHLNSINHRGHNDWRLPLSAPVNGTSWDFKRLNYKLNNDQSQYNWNNNFFRNCFYSGFQGFYRWL